MKVITTQQMEELEKLAAKEYGITQHTLMENAGCGIACWLKDFVRSKKFPEQLLIVCGRGNNGGDGFVAARHLADNGFQINVILLGNETDLKGAARSNFRKLKNKRKVTISKITTPKQLEKAASLFNQHSLILDGILGTGTKGEVKGLFKSVIEYINGLEKTVIAIDIPSGLDGNRGCGYSLKAQTTLTMGLPKTGLLKPEVEEHVGYLQVIDIGLPPELTTTLKSSIEYLQQNDFRGSVPERKLMGHKGEYGHVLVLAGSPQYTGAAALCTLGALRSGAGLVTLGIPQSLQSIYQIKLTDSMTLPLAETEDNTLSEEAWPAIHTFSEQVDCIAIGPGLTTHPETIKLVKRVIANSTKPLVIDADGINAIADEPLVLRKSKAPLILTPHPGEMARLLNTSTKGLLRDKWKIAQGVAEKYTLTLVLKGHHSIIAGRDKKIYINSSGNPGMATGGAGDILTGMIASFIAQGFKPLQSARLGVYFHGIAGDVAARDKGEWGIVASDILDQLPYVLNEIYGL